MDRSVSLIGNGTTGSIINGSLIDTVIKINSDFVNISHMSILSSGTNFDNAGIYMENFNNCNIFASNISDNYQGIYFNTASIFLRLYKGNGCPVISIIGF